MHIVALNWSIGSNYGWGTYGFEIAMHLARRGTPRVVLLQEPSPIETDELQQARFDKIVNMSAMTRAGSMRHKLTDHPYAMVALHALGNGGARAFARLDTPYKAKADVGLIFIESSRQGPNAVGRLAAYDMVIGGSRWNGALLEHLGVRDPKVCIQGVDTALFHPAPSRGAFKDRFVVFSGGKLEFRKGQDITIAAFRAFRSRHPEARLVSVWGNPWPRTPGILQFEHSPHCAAPPPVTAKNRIDWRTWMNDQGLQFDHITLFNHFAHDRLATLIREADVAVFANRAEGGTNLVAMETMACGVPTILSANTGHLDIIADGCCIPLRRQGPVKLPADGWGTDGWGESDVEEIVEALEMVWRDRARARAIGAAGAAHMAKHTWAGQVDQLLALIEPLAGAPAPLPD